tara:strand:- start:63 stop:272 length:210 start_codon:yes stop_codon:yes gene_type:complete
MTRFFINYYTTDNGWIEFKTREDRDKAYKELEEGNSDLHDVSNSEHWLSKAVIDEKGKDCEDRFVKEDV